MKIKPMIALVILTLITGILPISTTSANDPEKWVLVETHFGMPPDKNKGWEQTFLDVITFKQITLAESAFTYRETVKKAGTTTVDASFQFSFDRPPEELVPGETVRLSITGLSSGKGDVTEKAFALNVKEWIDDPPNNQTYTQLDRKVTGVIKSSLAEARVRLEGTAAEDKQILEFVVPEIMDGKLVICTSNNITADVGISWTFEPGESKSRPGEPDPSDDRPEWVRRSEELYNAAEEIYVPDWLEWMKPERRVTVRGSLIPRVSEDVWVYDSVFKKWRGPIRGEIRLKSGDMVSTGPQGDCMVVFTNAEGKQDTFFVGRDSLLEVPSNAEESSWPTLWSLYKGAVRIKRAVLREASLPEDLNPFLIRTPTVVCGIADRPRLGSTYDTSQVLLAGLSPSFGQYADGNRVVEEEWVEIVDLIVAHDQETKTSVIYVISGELNYYNMAAAGPEDAVMTAGQKLSVTKDGIETVITFTNAELDSLTANYELEQPILRSQDELEALFSEAEKGAASGFPVLAVVIGIIVIIAAGATFFLIRARKK